MCGRKRGFIQVRLRATDPLAPARANGMKPHFLGACRKMPFENRFVRVPRDTPGVRFWAPIGRYRRFCVNRDRKERLRLFAVWFPDREILSSVRTKENPGNPHKDCQMNSHLTIHREADRYVEGHPNEREPTCPVVSPEHECSRNDGQQFSEFDPHAVVLVCHQFGKVVSKADCPHCNIQTGENPEQNRALGCIHGNTSNTASLGSSASGSFGRTAPASRRARTVPTKSPVSRCQPFPEAYTAHDSAVPAYSRDFNSRSG